MVAEHERAESNTDAEFARALVARRQVERLTFVPAREDVEGFVDEILALFFPHRAADVQASEGEVLERLGHLRMALAEMLEILLPVAAATANVEAFMRALPDTYAVLRTDAEAITAGDPAAENLEEVIAAYPGFTAITVHRLAHVLSGLGAPILPRLLSEVAHARTGIDIHPGAQIGSSFCIDHGTGVVIGESAVIGESVKLYQGVTLGALSVSKEAAGVKRHPTIEDRVIIYANATILGGDTVIGRDSVIGGNVWLTASVPPSSYVYHSSQVRVRSVSDWIEPLDFSI